MSTTSTRCGRVSTSRAPITPARRPPRSRGLQIPPAPGTARSMYLAQDYDCAAMVSHFERDAISLIEQYPDVKFDIYFTPYSILQFVAMRDASPPTLKIANDF